MCGGCIYRGYLDSVKHSNSLLSVTFCFCLHLLLISLHRDTMGMPATHGSSVRALCCVKKQTKPVVWPPLRWGSVHCYHPPLLSTPACGVGEGRCCPRLYRPTSCTPQLTEISKKTQNNLIHTHTNYRSNTNY